MTGRELIMMVLEKAKKPLSVSEIWDIAEEKKYAKLYAGRTDAEQKKRQIGSELLRWYEEENSPIKRHEKGEKGNKYITYFLSEIIQQPPRNGVNDEGNGKNKRRGIPKEVREKVWEKFWGNNSKGMCIVCGNHISLSSFYCAHIEAHSVNKNDDITNLAPTCGQCNSGMATMDLREYKKRYHNDIDVHCKIDIFTSYITKEEVISILKKYTEDNIHAKYFKRALEMIEKN